MLIYTKKNIENCSEGIPLGKSETKWKILRGYLPFYFIQHSAINAISAIHNFCKNGFYAGYHVF